jgi:hypothetical protein
MEGNNVAYFEKDEYLLGRSETIIYTESNYDDDTCTIEIDGTECTGCTYVDCSDGEYFGIDVDCNNIDPTGESNFNTCMGTELGSTGIFTIYNEDYGTCYTSEDGCVRDMNNFMSTSDYNCQCTATEEEADNNYNTTQFQLECQNSCDHMVCNSNDSYETCADESFVQIYKSAVKESVTKTITYSKNRNDIVVLKESGCDNGIGCRICEAQMNNQQCTSCEMHSCMDETMKAIINCENIDPNVQAIDLCDNNGAAEDDGKGQFAYFTDNFECISPAGTTCSERRKEYMSKDPHLECTCTPNDDGSSSFAMNCSTDCGDVCNGSICFREILTQTFFSDSTFDMLIRNIQYTQGLNHNLAYREDIDTGFCELEVDGTKCNSCQIESCDFGPSPMIDCSNVDSNSVSTSCQRQTSGFLMRITTGEFETCEDRSPTNGQCQQSETIGINSLMANEPTSKQLISYSGSTIMIENDGTKSCVEGEGNDSRGLWYAFDGTGNGVLASVCAESTDFPAHISVYTGSCDNLTCVSTTVSGDNNCSIKFHATSGQRYMLKVHGSQSNHVGNFNLNAMAYNSTNELCSIEKESFESIENKQYSCECNEQQMVCENNCLMCNANRTLCGKEAVTLTFDSGSVVKQTESFFYLLGARDNQALVIERTMCPEGSPNCSEPSCYASIDGTPCRECHIISCESANDDSSVGMEIFCDNIDSSLNANTCSIETTTVVTRSNADMAFLFYSDELTSCEPKDASLSCLHEKSVYEGANENVQCHCYENSSTGEYDLACIDTTCLKCHEEIGFCGFPSQEKKFQPNGDVINSFGGFFIYEGRASSMTAEEVTTTMEPFECLQMRDPYDTCLSIREEVMNRDSVTNCDCNESLDGDGSYDLVCAVLPSCEYCDETNTLCAQPSHSQKINQFGYAVGYSYFAFAYTAGRYDIVAIEYESDACIVSINGERCSSCEKTNCDADGFAMEDTIVASSSMTRSAGTNPNMLWELSVDCSNIMMNATYTCGEITEDVKDVDSVLAILTGSMAEFACWDNATLPPVQTFYFPSFPPSQDPQTNETDTTLGDDSSATSISLVGLELQFVAAILFTIL